MTKAASPTTGSKRTPHRRLARQKVQYRLLLQLLAELEGNALTVGVVPCRRRQECGIRVAFTKNCTWYRKFCAAHPSTRMRRNQAPDTRIKRANTIRMLKALIAGRPSKHLYQAWVLRYVAMDTVKIPDNPF